MKTYAHIQDGKVVEIIVPMAQEFDSPEGVEPVYMAGDEVPIDQRFTSEFVAELIDITNTLNVVIGMTYDGTTFAAPVEAPPPAVDYVTVNAAQQVALMTTANAVTFGMADAYISGLLDDADTAKFKAWAAYKLALSKVDLTKAQPAWPTVPASGD
jgi:hypothetical protein